MIETSNTAEDGGGLTKRDVLKGLGAVALAMALPAWRRGFSAPRAGYDVIVIGGGNTGMPLAIAAAARGARVLVIEKSPVWGGTLDRSSASFSAAGTAQQKAAGIEDSSQDHYDDVMRTTRDAADPIVTRLWTDHAAQTMEWLIGMGVKFNFSAATPGPNGPYRKARATMIEGGGKGLLQALEVEVKKAQASGKVTAQFNSRAVDLIMDAKGAVTGVTCQDEKGVLTDVSGKNVVLAAGGCMANARMFQDLHQTPLYYATGYPYCQGDGLMLGQSAGGYLRGAAAYAPFLGVVMSDDMVPSVPIGGTFMETSINGNAKARPPWEIWVNARGERFVAEDNMTSQHREIALGFQPGHRLWTVHDQDAMDKGPSPMQSWKKDQYAAGFGTSSMFSKADNLHELGVLAGMDPHALSASVAEYNTALAQNAPDRFGRTVRPAQIVKAPFYAVRYQGYHLLSHVGLVVDHQLRVVREDGSFIPNLYASGEVLGATALGGSARATGAMNTPALTFGRILGQQLLRF